MERKPRIEFVIGDERPQQATTWADLRDAMIKKAKTVEVFGMALILPIVIVDMGVQVGKRTVNAVKAFAADPDKE